MSSEMHILVIPDTHAMPGYDNSRFSALGRMVAKHRPDIVLCMGDWRDLPSLCSHSSKADLWEADIMADFDVAAEAEQAFFVEALSLPKVPKRTDPLFVLLEGNHEARVAKIAREEPRLAGLLERPFHPAWDVVVPFKTPYYVPGTRVVASHYFVSGVMERPIGGANIGKKLVQKNHMSTIVGHSHLLDYYTESSCAGTRMFGLSAGCFVHPSYEAAWCQQGKSEWWNGITEIVVDPLGQPLDVRFTTQEQLWKIYG